MLFILSTALLLLSLSGLESTQAAKQSISLSAGNVSTYTPSDTSLGPYYTLEFQLPPDLPAGDLRVAVLEFYVDAQSFVRGDWISLDKDSVETIGFLNDSPVLELYPLKATFSGEVDFGQFDERYSAARPVVVGADRRVVLDVTSVIRSYLRSPSTNHGFVMGSLSEMREGKFTLTTSSFPDGSWAQLHLYTAPRARQTKGSRIK